jgi:lysozyme
MKKTTVSKKRAPVYKPKKKAAFFSRKLVKATFIGLLLFSLCLLSYHYRNGLAYYFSLKSTKTLAEAKDKRLSDVRNIQILEKHEAKAIGIDVSEYQGPISWREVDSLEHQYGLHFVFIRASVGNDRVDKRFDENWLGAKDSKLIRGAYHYYRPNENSLEQAALFIKTVTLHKGDLPPVLDIEQLPKEQSLSQLKIGLKRWLVAIENHYQVKPIIYTGEKYYDDFLKDEFGDYLFWIANYNLYREEIQDDWLFWQFTEKATVLGIQGNVDVNIYNGDLQQLQFITIE